ncbi:hypothetical protein GLYMA_18G144850v4 [Glycine max]|nr:hypothetical protein GLYMA_18G144850v4 [Glycine max]KAH1154551.1 hypothetical protein GYH30_050001 [Glycine max]
MFVILVIFFFSIWSYLCVFATNATLLIMGSKCYPPHHGKQMLPSSSWEGDFQNLSTVWLKLAI